jgi:hypothetical protein
VPTSGATITAIGADIVIKQTAIVIIGGMGAGITVLGTGIIEITRTLTPAAP